MAELNGACALVTGGAGMIGSAIVDQLIGHDVAEIRVLDDFSRGTADNLAWALAHGPVELVEGDIRDRQLVRRLTRGVDIVFHQAALRITQCAEEPRLALEVLAVGTFNVIEAAVDARVRRLVAASSASVYGEAGTFPTAESHHPWDNRTIYGAAKIFNESVLRSFEATQGLDYAALRYFNVYGPRMDAHGVYTEVLMRWMERIAAGQPPLIFGDGRQTMDFVYVDDVAAANIAAACIDDVRPRVFNVASGRETSLLELARALLRVMGSSLDVEYGPPRDTNAVHRRLADVALARKVLGFVTTVNLDEGLRRLVQWWMSVAGFADEITTRPGGSVRSRGNSGASRGEMGDEVRAHRPLEPRTAWYTA
jgi:UDP-glucose 4-epimerase